MQLRILVCKKGLWLARFWLASKDFGLQFKILVCNERFWFASKDLSLQFKVLVCNERFWLAIEDFGMQLNSLVAGSKKMQQTSETASGL